MKKSDVNITRYEEGNYCIDIVETKGSYEAWLSHKDYGISQFMIGCGVDFESKIDFIANVYTNLDEYINDYREQYEDA